MRMGTVNIRHTHRRGRTCLARRGPEARLRDDWQCAAGPCSGVVAASRFTACIVGAWSTGCAREGAELRVGATMHRQHAPGVSAVCWDTRLARLLEDHQCGLRSGTAPDESQSDAQQLQENCKSTNASTTASLAVLQTVVSLTTACGSLRCSMRC
jgi:hypothetical protein